MPVLVPAAVVADDERAPPVAWSARLVRSRGMKRRVRR
jgi:hypothetical protein